MSQTLTIRLDRDLADWLEAEARKTGASQGKIVRDQLARARAGGQSKPYMRLAGSVSGARNLSSRKGFSRS